MPRITIKGLADFILSGPSAQETTLRDYKYPSPQATGKTIYYQEVIDSIRTYCQEGYDLSRLYSDAAQLEMNAHVQSSAWHKARLNNNSRAILDFASNFSKLRYTITGVPKAIYFVREDLRVNASPDLRVKGTDGDIFVKFDFAAKKTDSRLARYLCEGMCMAANESRIVCSINQFKVIDVSSGREHCYPKCSGQAIKDIEAGCRLVNAVWSYI